MYNEGAMAGMSRSGNKALAVHELEHGGGLDHAHGEWSTMSYTNMYSTDGYPTAYDRSMLQRAWGPPTGAVPQLPAYTNGGIAKKPHMATVAENGPEFFMPLHDPSSTRAFIRSLQELTVGGDAGAPRETVKTLPEERRERRSDTREIAEAIRALKKANAEDRQVLVDEIVALKEEQRLMAGRVGQAIRGGTIENLRDDPEYGGAVEGSLNGTLRRKDFAGDFDWSY
jgi:hypothetical protein